MSRPSWSALFAREDELSGATHELVERARVTAAELEERYPAPASAEELRRYLDTETDDGMSELAVDAGLDRRTLEAIRDGSRTPQLETRRRIEEPVELRSQTIARDPRPGSWEELVKHAGLETDDHDPFLELLGELISELEEYERQTAERSRTVRWPSRPVSAANVRKARQRARSGHR
jgi:hypothetical protein